MSEARVVTSRGGGFTLIELMVVVAIVGILAAVAMPAYQQYVRNGYRASAESFLMDVAQREQQYFMDNRSYTNSLVTLGAVQPSDVMSNYAVNIAVVNGPPPTFTVTATPSGSQANDTCGALSLTNAGTKSASGGTNCW